MLLVLLPMRLVRRFAIEGGKPHMRVGMVADIHFRNRIAGYPPQTRQLLVKLFPQDSPANQ